MPPSIEPVLEKIREVRHFDFRHDERATLDRRIQRRMAERNVRDAAGHLELLELRDAFLSEDIPPLQQAVAKVQAQSGPSPGSSRRGA